MRRGMVVGDRFEVLEPAGRGAMGVVYRAHDRLTGELAALKVMLDAADGQRQARFDREVAVLAELRHPAIVRYLAHGTLASSERWLAMEWAAGETLKARLARATLTAAETLELGRRLAEALAVVHERGVVHRDLKPSNVILVAGDVAQPKLLDFGVVRTPRVELALTQAGAMVGTPAFMAPEQARGDPVGPPSDVFALGALLFACLTGKSPFAAESQTAVLLKLVLEPSPRIADVAAVSAPFAALMDRMLSKALGDRPRDGAEAARALALLDRARGPEAPKPPAVTVEERRAVAWVAAQLPRPEGRGEGTSTEAAELTIGRVAHDCRGAVSEPRADIFVITIEEPRTATDQAVRAARCALALRDTLTSARVRVGLVQDDASGGRVREAALRALDDGATDPTIRIDATVEARLVGRMDVAADGRGPILRGEAVTASSTRLLLGRPTRCVGREHELSMLELIVQRAVDERSAQAALVTAPAGVGKSRVRSSSSSGFSARGFG
ncbi:MAG: serine/threonine-protein kinase [Polyangiaceae bacterium]